MASNEVLPDPSVSAETPKACALIGLHLLVSRRRRSFPVCRESLDWDGDLEPWTVSEGTSSEQCAHNVESLALNPMGQDQSSWKDGNVRGWL